MNTVDTTRHLPLEPLHEAAGARFCPFAGWKMPLTYPAGVMKEHLHTREAAGLFDISHMQLFLIEGPDAAAFLSRACPLDASAIGLFKSKYTVFLNEQAGILDDVIVTQLSATRFIIVANAANAAQDQRHLEEIAKGFSVQIDALSRVLLALQGPAAESVLTDIGLDVSAMTFMTAAEPQTGWFVTRSGYTGEDGFEIALPVDEAMEFASKLLEDERVMWVGLAARDSLRLEAGLCLHGQDIDATTDPVRAGILWAIPKPVRENGDFVGAAALKALLASGSPEKRVGIKPAGRQPVRAGAQILDSDGNIVGRITSGGFGPSVGNPIAMGYVEKAHATPETALFTEVRGNRIELQVTPLPFIQHRYRKGNQA